MMDRLAFIIEDTVPVNCVVIAEGDEGDRWLLDNPNAVEATGLDPMPGLGVGWKYVDEEWVTPPAPQLTYEEVQAARRIDYQQYRDPLFFGWQRGENTEQDWLEAIQAIKDAYPYPE
jgi:hypothetical protein